MRADKSTCWLNHIKNELICRTPNPWIQCKGLGGGVFIGEAATRPPAVHGLVTGTGLLCKTSVVSRYMYDCGVKGCLFHVCIFVSSLLCFVKMR